MDNGSKHASRAATFNAATIGMRPYRIAIAFNKLVPGVDFRGLTKGKLRAEFVDGWLKDCSGKQLRAAIQSVDTPA